NANENPYGPSPAAIGAMRDAFGMSSRYPDDEADALVADIAKLHGVSAEEVILGDGSSEILKLVAAAYTSPSRPVVIADPTFEAIVHYAKASGADVVKVPLDAAYAHDLGKMSPANAGVVYVCNPNNPTGSITPKAALRSEEHTSELQSRENLVCRLPLEKKNQTAPRRKSTAHGGNHTHTPKRTLPPTYDNTASLPSRRCSRATSYRNPPLRAATSHKHHN